MYLLFYLSYWFLWKPFHVYLQSGSPGLIFISITNTNSTFSTRACYNLCVYSVHTLSLCKEQYPFMWLGGGGQEHTGF